MKKTGPGRPRETSHDELREIAHRLFAEQGYAKTSLTQIAAEAGISRTTLFSYFPAKSDLMWEKLDAGEARLHERLDQNEGEPVMDAIVAAMVVLVESAAGDHDGLRLRWRLALEDPELRMATAGRTEQLLAAFTAHVRKRAPRVDPERLDHVAHAISAVTSRCIEQWAQIDEPAESLGAYVEARLQPFAERLRSLVE